MRSAADVETLMSRLGGLREPFLVDARIDQSQPAEFIELLHRLKAAPA